MPQENVLIVMAFSTVIFCFLDVYHIFFCFPIADFSDWWNRDYDTFKRVFYVHFISPTELRFIPIKHWETHRINADKFDVLSL